MAWHRGELHTPGPHVLREPGEFEPSNGLTQLLGSARGGFSAAWLVLKLLAWCGMGGAANQGASSMCYVRMSLRVKDACGGAGAVLAPGRQGVSAAQKCRQVALRGKHVCAAEKRG